ncbi:MAG: flagellar hook-associated protein FlgL [Sulfuricella sp.]|nr:flagellar hook-associated protein FlgL [Sulfuricella sp.]
MRISTNTIYESGVGGIQQQAADFLKTQQQIAASRRILTPADDPIASAKVLEVSQSSSLNKQYDTNMGSATSALEMEDTTLGSIVGLLLDVRTSALQAPNSTVTDQNRAGMATALRGSYQALLGLANSTDGNGQYLFSGYKGTTRPFAENASGTGVTYQGDQGQRLVQITTSRQIAVSDSGADVFQGIRNGNGTIVAAADAANTGTGVIEPATVTNLANPDLRDAVTIQFTSATTFDVADATTGAALATGASFAAGGVISYNGWSMSIKGTPQAGDTFTVRGSSNVDMFKTLGDLIAQLETPASGSAADFAKLTNGVRTAIQNLDQALQNISTVRASVGARMNENDAAQIAGADLQLQYKQTLSTLQDLDYTQALTDLAKEQTSLEAAQQSFVKIQGLSLFDYIR